MTERKIVLRERAAFLAGEAWSREISPRYIFTQLEDEREARRRYPLPKVTRVREVRDPETSHLWRVLDGQLEFRDSIRWFDAVNYIETNGVQRYSCLVPIPSRVEMWANLLTSPTEEVEDGA